MTYYAVVWTYTEDQSVIGEAKPDHTTYVKELARNGALKEAGAWEDGSGALLVFDVEGPDELAALLDGDPYSQSGVITATTINAWRPGLGLLAG